MKITKLNEAGYEESALGVSLSYNSTIERAKQIMPKLAFGRGGERKFLEMIDLWLDVSAPRYWWQEADTYRLTTKQSESTMHTLKKKPLSQENFEHEVPEMFIDLVNKMIEEGAQLVAIKNCLPEGFIQRRIWKISYANLQNIYGQRHDHRLKEWHIFLHGLLMQVEHPEFICPLDDIDKL